MNSPWECPRCGAMNAPFIPQCICKPKELVIHKVNDDMPSIYAKNLGEAIHKLKAKSCDCSDYAEEISRITNTKRDEDQIPHRWAEELK